MDPTESLATPRNHDIVMIISHEHGQLLERLDLWLEAPLGPSDFWSSAQELAKHEFAEELSLYPALKACGESGAEAAAIGLRQQEVTERLLLDLEKEVDADGYFGPSLTKLVDAVRNHARYEETHLLPLLADALDDDQRMVWGDRYTQAKKGAPTRPHPGAPVGVAGRQILGPMAAVADRVRDLMKGRGDR